MALGKEKIPMTAQILKNVRKYGFHKYLCLWLQRLYFAYVREKDTHERGNDGHLPDNRHSFSLGTTQYLVDRSDVSTGPNPCKMYT